MKLGDTVFVNNIWHNQKGTIELDLCYRAYRRISEVIKTIKLNKDGTVLSSKNGYILDNGKPWILGVPEITSRIVYDEKQLIFNKEVSRNNRLNDILR
jgi:hypothetical protein